LIFKWLVFYSLRSWERAKGEQMVPFKGKGT
jgi:hypothetical protein